ncbi:MAG: Stf0 family sulfotransferase [Acidimicrobiales bacterium]
MAAEGPGAVLTRRSVILCTQMRSGSWMLSDLCQQTGLLGQPEEYFRPDYRPHWSAEWGITLPNSYALYVASAIRNTSTPNGVFGVKLHAYQMNWFLRQLRVTWGTDPNATDGEILERWLPSAVFVHLWRRDVARQAISYYRAARSDVWFELREDDPAATEHNPAERPTFAHEPAWGEIRYFENALETQERTWSRFFATTGIKPLELAYEELVDEPVEAVHRILALMDIEPPDDLEIRPRLRRQSDDDTERWLERYLACRDSVTPVPPQPKRLQDSKGSGSDARRGDGTEAASLFPDAGPPPAELGPSRFVDGTASWAELVASLVISGLPMSAAAALVDALPGEGAPRTPLAGRTHWRRSRTPLPRQQPVAPDELPGRRLVGEPARDLVSTARSAVPVDRTHIVVATPWAGGWRLCNLMGRTGTMATPLPWFDPLRVPAYTRDLEVASDDRPWAARYLAAVRERATTDRVCAFSMMWLHQRWLLQIARLALGSDADGRAMLDPEVLAASFPNPSYVWVQCSNAATQALRWYVSRHPELAQTDLGALSGAAPGADFQEVRWLESAVLRQEKGWETYFAIHGITPVVVSSEDLAAEPVAEAVRVVKRLGYEPSELPISKGATEEIEAAVGRLAEPYRRARSRLSSAVGVRAKMA